MKKMKKRSKGFTLTELAIVIAVIAILIAVLVPTFVSIINKANESSDQQAVKNMNTALATDEAINGKPETVSAAMRVIEDAGLDPNGYQALVSDTAIYYSTEINRMLYVQLDDGSIDSIIYPTEYSLATVAGTLYNMSGRKIVDSSWLKAGDSKVQNETQLNTDISTAQAYSSDSSKTRFTAKENYAYFDSSNKLIGVAVADADGLIAVSEYVEGTSDGADGLTVLIGSDVALSSGYEWKPISEFSGAFYGNGYTVSGINITDATADSKQFSAASAESNYSYYGFISVFSGTYFGDITLQVNIDEPGNGAYVNNGYNRKNHTTAGAIGGIVLGEGDGYNSSYVCTVNNVTVNGKIVGTSRVAGVVGYIGGYSANGYRMTCTVKITNCTNNATVSSASQESGTYATAGGIVSIVNQWSGTINITDCTNTGSLTGLWVGGIMADAWRSNVSTYTNNDAAAAKINFSKCENSGTLTGMTTSGNDTSNVSIIVGGIFGHVSHAKNNQGTETNPMTISVSECKNSGTLTYDVSVRSSATNQWTAVFLGQITSLDAIYFLEVKSGSFSQNNLSDVTSASGSYSGISNLTLSGNTASGSYSGSGATSASGLSSFSKGTSYVWQCDTTSYNDSTAG